MKTLLGMAVLVLLTACGGEPAAEPKPSPKPSATARPAEPAECREAVEKANAAAQQLAGGGLEPRAFSQEAARLKVLTERADNTCSNDVMQPLTEAGYHFALANTYVTICETIGSCKDADVAEEVVTGGELADKAVTAANRTR